MDKTKIAIETSISSDIEKLWEYWTKPDHITKWNFASDDWHCPRAENDLRVGGRLLCKMAAKDGSFCFDFEAIYDEVIEHNQITYTMLDGRKAITTFEKIVDKINVSTTFDAENDNPLEMQKEGWQAILNNFKKYVESN